MGYKNGVLSVFGGEVSRSGEPLMVFEGVPWNFRMVCSQTQTQGRGFFCAEAKVSLPTNGLVWVMGPGLKIPRTQKQPTTAADQTTGDELATSQMVMIKGHGSGGTWNIVMPGDGSITTTGPGYYCHQFADGHTQVEMAPWFRESLAARQWDFISITGPDSPGR